MAADLQVVGFDTNGATITDSDGRDAYLSVFTVPGTDTGLYFDVAASVNGAPTVANPIADRSSPEDAAWSFQLAGDAFSDPDGDTLTFSATLASGAALPAWLSFNADTRTFSGTPPANFNGAIDLTVTASDASSSASDTFRLTVTPVNDAPVAVGPNTVVEVSSRENLPWTFQYPAAAFSAPDGDALTWSATLASGGALPGWLSFNTATHTFSGTPPGNFTGAIDLKVTASDGAASACDDFRLTITTFSAVHDDFGGDDKADILWRNTADGRVGIWEMNGSAVSWAGTIASLASAWQISDTGDFTGDGKADILLRNTADGRVGLWEMNGRTLLWAGTVATIDTSWQVAEAADFNGDGKSDILLRNSIDGRLGIWEMDGGAVTWGGTIGALASAWQIAETGDFTGDGKADILLRNTADGRIGIWEMNGHTIAWGGTIATLNSAWQMTETADFNGDGKDDILLRNTADGRLGIWEMNGHTIAWGGTIGALDSSWQIAETADYNGDGKDDILLRNTADGRVGLWEMDGHTIAWGGAIANVNADWHIMT